MKNSASRMTVALLLLVSATILAGCVLNPQEQPTPVPYASQTPTPPRQMACSELPALEARDACNYEYALSRGITTDCWKVTNSSLRDECLVEFAKRQGNISICASVSGQEGMNQCYLAVALAGNSTSACDMLPSDERRACYLELNDTSILCEGIEEGYARTLCMADSRMDVSICGTLGAGDSDMCIQEYASAHGDLSACTGISDPRVFASCVTALAGRLGDFRACGQIGDAGLRDACLAPFLAGPLTNELCYMVSADEPRIKCLAKADGNHRICNLLNDIARIDSCLEGYATHFKEVRYCSYINLTSYANTCYANLSLSMGQPDLCANLVPELERDKCFRDYAVATRTIEVCDRVILDSIKMPCQSDIAYAFDLPQYCNRIEGAFYRERCYAMIIERATHAPSDCKQIEMDKWRDECYLRVAIRLGDSSYCDPIKSPVAKTKCLAGFS